MFWKIIAQTPLFVWPLLALLIWGGIRSKKTHVVSWKSLLIFPTIMFLWSAYNVFVLASALTLSTWAVSIGLGLWLGYLTLRNSPIGFDKERKALVIPGSYIPLILSLSIFTLRYVLGVMHAVIYGFSDSISYLALENAASIVSGMFLGRLLCCKLRLKTA